MEEVEKKTLAACIMSKDDEDCLRENIEYHSLIGVEHFFIYDNQSQIPLSESLKDYNNVTVIKWTDNKIGSHCRSQLHCLKNFKHLYEWMAMTDTDEFIVMKDGNTDLKEFLKPYSKYGGLGVNWKMFGGSGHATKQQSVIESFTQIILDSSLETHIKSIVNTQYVDSIKDTKTPHGFFYKKGTYAVGEDIKPISGKWGAFRSPSSHEKIQINHYAFRSREEFQEKITRGGGNRRGPTLKSYHQGSKNHQDDSILKLVQKIKLEKND